MSYMTPKLVCADAWPSAAAEQARQLIILRHAAALVDHHAQVVLRPRIALLGRATVPAQRLAQVTRNAGRAFAQHAQVGLRRCKAERRIELPESKASRVR